MAGLREEWTPEVQRGPGRRDYAVAAVAALFAEVVALAVLLVVVAVVGLGIAGNDGTEVSAPRIVAITVLALGALAGATLVGTFVGAWILIRRGVEPARARLVAIAGVAGLWLVLMVVDAFSGTTVLQWVTRVLAIGVGSLVGARLASRSRVEHLR